jgi:hypothetical protein
MAKRKSAAPARARRAKVREPKRVARKAAARKAARKPERKPSRRPKQPTFSEMGPLKDRQLSKLASRVADERHIQSESKSTEDGLKVSAQRRMQALGATTFTDHGVEFIRVPGEEKFRVRLTGEDTALGGATEGATERPGKAEREPEGAAEPGPGDEGEGTAEDLTTH